MDESSKAELMSNDVAGERELSSNETETRSFVGIGQQTKFSGKQYVDRVPSTVAGCTKAGSYRMIDIDNMQPERPKATLFFNDGVRRIDYVLAYEDDVEGRTKEKEKRERFEAGLMEAGVQLEWEPKEKSQDQKTCFVKIHAPWRVLLKYAEIMRFKMPLKEDRPELSDEELAEKRSNGGCYHQLCSAAKCCTEPCTIHSQDIQEETEYYTAEFSREKQQFFNIKSEETFFSNAERSRVVYRILSETRFGTAPLQLGIQRLISQNVYDSAFPLHEGKHRDKNSKLPANSNMRRLLYCEWARWGRWYKFQPLDLIRSYLGEKIAMYFAFLGFYSQMLIIASLVGLLVVIVGAITVTQGDNASREICDETFPTYVGNETMCPVCDVDCPYWKLKASCIAAQFTHVFDNDATIFFAVFMSLWATMFLEFWKRRQFRLSYEWDLVDYDEERDLIRPEFEAVVKKERLNPVTQQKEPYLEATQRYSRAALSLVTVLFWIVVILAAVFAVIVYRLAIKATFAVAIDLTSIQDVDVIGQFATPQMLTTITASCISLVVIMILNKVYEYVAIWLTNMELPRTQIEFEDSFTFKMFCFQFVNYYSYLFYIAFFKTSIAGYPSNYTYLGEWRWEQCDPGGCMYELSVQLIIIMLGKQLWNNVIEIMMPWVLNTYRQYRSRKARREMPDNEYTRWEQDYDLQGITEFGLFYEYLEMVIQFGFVTLFVAAFPLAPLLALINNIIEVRLDANKFICELRRPLAEKCSDIGAWYYLLDFIATLSVVTNSFTIAITSETIPKMVYYYVYSVEPLGKFTENTDLGYTNNSLSYFATEDFSSRSTPSDPDPFNTGNITICRYRDYRSGPGSDPKYSLTMQYWHVIAARLAFVIAMEHIIFMLKRFLDYMIPDRPEKLQNLIKREHFLIKDMMVKAEAENLWRKVKKTEDEIEGRPHTRVVQPMMSSAYIPFRQTTNTTPM